LFAGGEMSVASAPQELDQPGAEILRDDPDVSLLQPLLPPFTATPVERDPDAEGWGPLRLSPTGRYLLAEVRTGNRQSVQLLDADGRLLRDLTRDQAPFASAVWGATDQQLLLECRGDAGSRPRFLAHNPVSAATTAVPRGGLAEWASGGKDYLLALAAGERTPGRDDLPSGYQRYTAAHDPVGRPLMAEEPTWSGDGQWLAFLTGAIKGAEPAAPLQLREIRLLPARGDVPRVVLSRGGWERLAKEQAWQQATGPESLAWSPNAEALFCLCTARAELDGQRFLVRVDVRTPRREVLPVPVSTQIVSVSADARHWIVRLGSRLYRLDFKVAPPKKRPAGVATASR
jgi:hypothetical protein